MKNNNRNSSLQPTLILGNGFNMALHDCCPEINIRFGYQDILNAVIKKCKDQNPSLYAYLSQSNIDENEKISDLEILLSILNQSTECIKYCSPQYCNPTSKYEESINIDKKILKKYVIEVLTDAKYHPKYADIFCNDKNEDILDICASNLRNFEKIFTINYDLILYWILTNKDLIEKKNHLNQTKNNGKFRDGFTSKQQFRPSFENRLIEHLYGHSSNNTNANLCFLHGAIHLFKDSNRAYKIVRKDSYLSLQEIKDNILSENPGSIFDSLIVFDATSYEKIKNIYANSYLQKSYDKITSIQGDIAIYGCNILDKNKNVHFGNDIHLWRRVINSGAKRVFFGVDSEKYQLNDFAKKIQSELNSVRCIKKVLQQYIAFVIEIYPFGNQKIFINQSLVKHQTVLPYKLMKQIENTNRFNSNANSCYL